MTAAPTDPGHDSDNATLSRTSINLSTPLSVLSWGSGSAPSLPSVDDEQTEVESIADTTSIRYGDENAQCALNLLRTSNVLTSLKVFDDRYLGPEIDLQHQLFTVAIGNRLNIAPIPDNVGRVLDIATGTGIWAIDFATQHPESEVIGTELSPIQPQYLPENCKFEIDDAEDEWTFGEPFDFIHGRALMSCFDDPAAVVRQAAANLAPGGVLEFQDALFPMSYVGEPPAGSALYRWNELMLEGVARLGRSWSNAKNYRDYFEDAGLERVVEKRFYWPTSPWAKGAYFKTVAAWFQEDMLVGIEAMSLKVLGGLGMDPDQVRDFVEEVRKDLRDTNIHAYLTVTYIYGFKPES
ncbi:S-adenosyl-L-methionine-dependent methyltransferase [Hypoxylon sp. FL1284]|nr:S-adenosyl-L-methionine-dependent methyltransferase [Hypoxylon sp. FL1284]